MEYIIYSPWVAYELRKVGCKFIRTDYNRRYPQYTTWVFENSKLLQETLTKITNKN